LDHRALLAVLALLVTALLADYLLAGGAVSLFLARKMIDFVQLVAFWRH
jgi:hypothetical protein